MQIFDEKQVERMSELSAKLDDKIEASQHSLTMQDENLKNEFLQHFEQSDTKELVDQSLRGIDEQLEEANNFMEELDTATSDNLDKINVALEALKSDVVRNITELRDANAHMA